MKLTSSLALSAAALLLTVAPSFAGPCQKQISEAEAAFDAKLNAAAAAGASAPQTVGATLHHQPTPGSVARAEAQVGDISPENAQIVTEALGRAHAADDAGDVKVCERELETVRNTMLK